MPFPTHNPNPAGGTRAKRGATKRDIGPDNPYPAKRHCTCRVPLLITDEVGKRCMYCGHPPA